jgi:hypothetical protein
MTEETAHGLTYNHLIMVQVEPFRSWQQLVDIKSPKGILVVIQMPSKFLLDLFFQNGQSMDVYIDSWFL